MTAISGGTPRRRVAATLTTFRPTDSTHSVTTLELFFDLVFVFAFSQALVGYETVRFADARRQVRHHPST